MLLKFFLFIYSSLFLLSCSSKELVKPTEPSDISIFKCDSGSILLGNENFLKNYVHLVKGKHIGLLTNPSGVNSCLQSTADIFAAHPEIQLSALFGPEHGIRGAVYAGEKVKDTIDPATGLPVFSLYGVNRKPSAEMLSKIDGIIVDIQDIGVRAYTYIYTMAKVMEAAAEHGKKVIVLDRPNPLSGNMVEGNLVEKDYFSFVGLYPLPYRHGLTIGELAKLFNTEYNIGCDLTVIPMIGWERSMLWDETELGWIPPSPHVPHWKTVLFMSTTGTFGELHTLSEGVGYTSPFELVGAPWINGEKFAKELNDLNLPGVFFRPLFYKPYYGTFKSQVCEGVQIHLTDPQIYKSYSTGFYIMETVMKMYPEQNLFSKSGRVKMFNKVVGCDWIMNDLKSQVPVPEIEYKWQTELLEFKEIREKYFLYK